MQRSTEILKTVLSSGLRSELALRDVCLVDNVLLSSQRRIYILHKNKEF